MAERLGLVLVPVLVHADRPPAGEPRIYHGGAVTTDDTDVTDGRPQTESITTDYTDVTDEGPQTESITTDYTDVTDEGGSAWGSYSYTPIDRKSTRLNSSHSQQSRMPSSA